MRRFLFENSLSLVFGALFLLALAGQSLVGQRALNDVRSAHDEQPVSYLDYVFSADFGRAVMENWQSEYLQFTLFIVATVWLVQKGSNESKPLDQVGRESDQNQQLGAHAPAGAPAWAGVRGWRTAFYANSLLIAMATLFLGSWLAQSVTAWSAFNEEAREHGEAPVSWAAYLGRADFWERTLQNWQSEFLAVGTMAVFTIYLRQRGSPESKPVGAPHEQTGTSG
jgi:Domain of unknown function (DUF6766)